MAAKLGSREQKVLDVVAENQLGHGKPALVQHVLLAYPHEVVDLVRTAVAALDAGGFVESTRESAGPGLQLTPLGLMTCKYAGEAAAFAERLLAWLKRRARDGAQFTEYTWEELRSAGVATADREFFLAVVVVQLLELSGGNGSLGGPPHTAKWSVPDDLADLRGADEIGALRLRAQRRRTKRSKAGDESLPAEELVAMAERFEKTASGALVEVERLRAGALAPRESERVDLQDQLAKLRREIEEKDSAIEDLQSAAPPSGSQALDKAKEERAHQRAMELKLAEQSHAKDMEVMRLQNAIRLAEINAGRSTAVEKQPGLSHGQPLRRTILFLASNPDSTTPLALGDEARDIEAKIRATEHRDSLVLRTRWAVRADDLLQALNEDSPTVVHFSGHGAGAPGIVLHGDGGGKQNVKADALKHLFVTLKDDIRVVVMNACYSVEQARSIVDIIDCVIGMSDSIGDEAARKFAASFYRALGFGRSVQNAFDQGVAALKLDGLPDERVPVLLVRTGIRAEDVFVVPPRQSQLEKQERAPDTEALEPSRPISSPGKPLTAPIGDTQQPVAPTVSALPPKSAPARPKERFLVRLLGGLAALAIVVAGTVYFVLKAAGRDGVALPERNPQADLPCPDAIGQQRIPYRNATICVSNGFVEFLACLEASKLEEVVDDAKKTVQGTTSASNGQTQASAKAEASAIGSVQTKYSKGPLADAVGACTRKYEGVPPVYGRPTAGAVSDAAPTALAIALTQTGTTRLPTAASASPSARRSATPRAEGYAPSCGTQSAHANANTDQARCASPATTPQALCEYIVAQHLTTGQAFQILDTRFRVEAYPERNVRYWGITREDAPSCKAADCECR